MSIDPALQPPPAKSRTIYTDEYYQSRKAFIRGYVVSGLLVGGAIPLGLVGWIPAVACATLGIINATLTDRKRKWHSVEVAKNKVSVHRGLLTRHSYSIFYDDIVDIKVHQTFWQRMLGYGSIYVNNPTKNHHQFCAHNMPNPQRIAHHIERMERNYSIIRNKPEEFD